MSSLHIHLSDNGFFKYKILNRQPPQKKNTILTTAFLKNEDHFFDRQSVHIVITILTTVFFCLLKV